MFARNKTRPQGRLTPFTVDARTNSAEMRMEESVCLENVILE